MYGLKPVPFKEVSFSAACKALIPSYLALPGKIWHAITFTSLGEPAMVSRPSRSWKYLTGPVGLIPQFCSSVDNRCLFVISSPAARVPSPFAPARSKTCPFLPGFGRKLMVANDCPVAYPPAVGT